jgi:hypothetical protein
MVCLLVLGSEIVCFVSADYKRSVHCLHVSAEYKRSVNGLFVSTGYKPSANCRCSAKYKHSAICPLYMLVLSTNIVLLVC